MNLLPADAEALIMQARLKLGWIEAPSEEEPESDGEAEAAGQDMASEGGPTEEAR